MKRYPVGNRIFIPRMVMYNNTNRKAEERNEEDKNLPEGLQLFAGWTGELALFITFKDVI
ncbi:MAG: hypothetical protein ACLUUG_06115 [Lachnospiraceae bacterium]